MEIEDVVVGARESIRQEKIAERGRMPSELRHELSLQIIQKLEAHIKSKNFKFIHCYISFRSEVETREFIESEIKSGIRVVVPLVGESGRIPSLLHSEIEGLSNLKAGKFGLDEPAERKHSSLEGLDAVIVPLAAFDRSGTRLGYGKGFYDAFLRDLPGSVERIGIAYAAQEVENIPALPHDEPLDIIITEREEIIC